MLKGIFIVLMFITSSFAMGKGPALVNTALVTKGVVNPLEEFIGTISFSRTSQVASSTDGIVKQVNFEAGDKIKKGTVLIKVDSDILDSKIKSAKANLEVAQIELENAKKDYKRYEKLILDKAISQKVYDDSFFRYSKAQASLNSVQASLDELKVLKNKKSIKAPFDAIVSQKSVEIAQWVSPGKVIAELIDTSSIDLVFNLPSDYIYKLDKNENYSINIKGKEYKSKIYANIPKGDVRTRTFPIKFKTNIKNQFLYDGMEAKIKLPRDKKLQTLTVPRDAVIKRFGQNVVFLNVDGSAKMIPVKILGYTKTNVAIGAKGIKEGAKVVVKGNERIFPNQPIKSLN
jgi:RND family efflux transporter MFP subunit